MDSISDSDSEDAGSIPAGTTTEGFLTILIHYLGFRIIQE